jgi:hypothetical protein
VRVFERWGMSAKSAKVHGGLVKLPKNKNKNTLLMHTCQKEKKKKKKRKR